MNESDIAPGADEGSASKKHARKTTLFVLGAFALALVLLIAFNMK